MRDYICDYGHPGAEWVVVFEDKEISAYASREDALKVLDQLKASRRRVQLYRLAALLIFALLGALLTWTTLTIIAMGPPNPWGLDLKDRPTSIEIIDQENESLGQGNEYHQRFLNDNSRGGLSRKRGMRIRRGAE